MTDETGATGTQADPATQPQAGTTGAQAATADGEQSGQPESISLDDARKLRSEASSLRRRLKELEDREAAAEAAKLTEQERLTRANADLAARIAEQDSTLSEMRIASSVTTAAAKLGFVDPADALRMLDRASIQFGEDGSPVDIEKQLAAIATAKPYLVAKRAVGSFDSGRGAPTAGQTTFTRDQLRDPTFYAANAAAIQAAMRAGRITG